MEKDCEIIEDLRTLYKATHHLYDVSYRQVALPDTMVNYLSFEDLRSQSLTWIKLASENFRSSSEQQMRELKIKRIYQDQPYDLPIWNLLHHSFYKIDELIFDVRLSRKRAGNPMPEGVDFFNTRKE